MRIVDAFEGRGYFATLLRERGIREAVEIGTDRGTFARELLAGWDGMLWCVDPYEPYPHMPWPREPDMALAITALAPFADRVRIVRTTGRELASCRADFIRLHVGFVYIDGDHGYDAVAADISDWWPLLRRGSILAGHDFDPDGRHAPGVLAAVREFAETHDVEIHLVRDHDAHSWFAVKP